MIAEDFEVDASVEASVVRKLDFRLLPVLSFMYFFNSLDRSSLGNAKTDGIDRDLHLVGSVTYSLFDLPSNLLLTRFSGKAMLPAMMLGWYV